MENKLIDIPFSSFSIDELSPEDLALWEAAGEARALSYSPYSQFTVGAAIRLSDGSIMKGANQENAAFPAGLCAERVLLYAKGAEKPNLSIECMAIHAGPKDKKAVSVTPCGGCRQVMVEFIKRQNKPFKLLFMHQEGKIAKVENAADLLPFIFDF